MATALTIRPNSTIIGNDSTRSTRSRSPSQITKALHSNRHRVMFRRRTLAPPIRATSQADDSAPSDMSLEKALNVLGVLEGASFEDILRAKNSVMASCKDDQQAIGQVEAAYDLLLMQSLSQRRAGKVVNSNVRYADVKPVNAPPMPAWLKNLSVSIEAPSTNELGIEAGVYGALIVLTYVNGSSPSGSAYASADIPGLLLAAGFGASLYFMTKKNVKLGKATLITIGGLVAGAVVGSVVENLLHVDIVPFMGVHTPATVIGEFILVSQFLVSLYLR